MNVPTIPASVWNKVIDLLLLNRVMGIRVQHDRGFRHPWNVQPRWDPKAKQWLADIQPGFVNGLAATALIDGADIPLTAAPQIPLAPFHDVTGAEVPPYFVNLGVSEKEPLNFSIENDMLIFQEDFRDRAQERRLMACDIVLHQDRPSLTTEWTTGSGIDGTFAQFSVGAMLRPGARKAAYVRAVGKWVSPEELTNASFLDGTAEDSGVDSRLLATVYLLSQPGTGPEAPIDETWIPFAQHALFWNLNHATNLQRPALARLTLRLSIGLAGGFGDTVANTILAQVNDANSVASEFIGRERIEGRFWTV